MPKGRMRGFDGCFLGDLRWDLGYGGGLKYISKISLNITQSRFYTLD